MSESPPTYASAVRFYRDFLKITYETGSRLRKLGILPPDAICDDNRALFLIDSDSIRRAYDRIHQQKDILF
jgi:hypothetical protein